MMATVTHPGLHRLDELSDENIKLRTIGQELARSLRELAARCDHIATMSEASREFEPWHLLRKSAKQFSDIAETGSKRLTWHSSWDAISEVAAEK